MLGLGNCNCLTRTRLLCQKERRLKKQRESKRSWASEEGRKLNSWGEGTAGAGGGAEGERRVLEGLRRLQRQECTGAFSVHVHRDAGGDLEVRTRV